MAQANTKGANTGKAKGGDEIIAVEGLRTQFGPQVIHEDLEFRVRRGEVMGVVGGSGTGKSVLMRTIIGLIRPAAGRITVLGQETSALDQRAAEALQQRWGVLFQDGALFSSLTVAENISVPLREHSALPLKLQREMVELKISLAGLPPEAANKYPSELSGGMRKRAGLARALALDPEILFLDEPTAGLDPIGASRFDELIRELQRALTLTVVLVTHDLDTLHATCDRISALINKRVKVGTIEQLLHEPDPWLQEYFGGPRGRAALRSQAPNGQTDDTETAEAEPSSKESEA